jgi:hypothetical protein
MVAAPVHADPRPSLLEGKTPIGASGVTHTERLNDGHASEEGDEWLTDVTARLRTPYSWVAWDLGSAVSLRCASLQGDNNDEYVLQGSLDGTRYFPVWTAPPEGAPGMRTRHARFVASARYLRLSARGGDGSYSVGEIAVWNACPDPWPQAAHTVPGIPLRQATKTALYWFVVTAMLFILLFDRRKHLTWALGLVPLFAGLLATSRLTELYPFANEEHENLLRGVVAAIAAAVLVRETFFTADRRLPRRLANGLLGFLGLLSVGCYYHFGAPQFWHASEGRRTYVHTFDMRHYFPVAKHFAELRFDGLYAGSFAAYLDLTGKTVDDAGDVAFRDLRVSVIRRANEMKDHITEVRSRFSDERWAVFKTDMKFFLDVMGERDYLGSMGDHGGNATPVWLLGGHALLRWAPATETVLVLSGVLDPILLVFLFVALWRTFGFRVMAYCLILFGATDFYQFGSNLMGSMLRQDWLVALGLGACAFKRGQYATGGALTAYGGLIRAFPALATFFLAVPVFWFIFDLARQHRKAPSLKEIRAAERPALRAMAGAVATVVILFVVSSAVFGLRGAWGTWSEKIAIHARDPSVNNVGLRNVMAYSPRDSFKALRDRPDAGAQWEKRFFRNLEKRRPLRYAILFLVVGAAVVAARRRPLEEVAMYGLTLIPFVFYPSNYYLHFIFLLPLLAVPADDTPSAQRRFARTVLAMLAVCVAQYYTYEWSDRFTDLQYTYQSFLALGGLAIIIFPDAWERWRELMPPKEKVVTTAPSEGPTASPPPA